MTDAGSCTTLVGMGKGERNDHIRLMTARSALDRATLAEALDLVEIWNAKLAEGARPQFSPSIGCAINAGMPWLRLLCPGCHQLYEIDLRRIVRPRNFPITGLRLTCESGCRGQAPAPQLLGLFALPELPASRQNRVWGQHDP